MCLNENKPQSHQNQQHDTHQMHWHVNALFFGIKTILKQYLPHKKLKSEVTTANFCMETRFIRTEIKLRISVCKNTFAGAHNYCHLCSAPRTSGDVHPWLRVTSYLCKTRRDACAETRVSPLADSNVGVGSKLVTHLRKRRRSSEAQPFKWRV